MMTEKIWTRNIPPHSPVVEWMCPPNAIEVSYVGTAQVADVSDKLTFTIGGRIVSIVHPHIEGRHLTMGRNTYVGITRLCRPPITNIGTGRDRIVSINAVAGPPITFSVPRRSTVPSCRWGGRFWYSGIPPGDVGRFTQFPIRPVDREWINRMMGASTAEYYVRREDIQFCYDLFTTEEEWNWKHLDDLRVLTIEESFLCHLLGMMRWISRSEVEDTDIQRAADRFWTGNPQLQYQDPNLSDIAKVALVQKVHFPVERFSSIEDAIPDPSWLGLLDSLSTPQSELAGSIISLCSSVTIEDSKITWR